jgi:hypothetical protein
MEDSVFKDALRSDRYPSSELTPREQQVLELVEQGFKNREIALELGIRPGTVKIHSQAYLREDRSPRTIWIGAERIARPRNAVPDRLTRSVILSVREYCRSNRANSAGRVYGVGPAAFWNASYLEEELGRNFAAPEGKGDPAPYFLGYSVTENEGRRR